MDISDSVYIGIIAVFFVVSLAGMGFLGAPAEAGAAVNATEELLAETGGAATVQPTDRWTTLCLGSGCIPPVDTPEYVPASEVAWMDSGDQLLAVSSGDDAIGIPLPLLRFHGVVNTWIGGTPVAVTYSPYSDVPAVYNRSVGGRTLAFEHSGKLYNGNMVMQDRATQTRWSQFTGTAIDGELAGTQLQRLDAHTPRWSIWRRNNPQGGVASRHTGIYEPSRYEDTPYFAYHRSRDVPVHGAEFSRHPKQVVYGLEIEGAAAAYRVAHIRAEDVIEDVVGGTPVMVVQDEVRDRFLAFDRRVNGQPRSFALVNGTLQDTETGSTWTVDGEAVDGPMDGSALQRIELTRSYWFTWRLFHPDTALYRLQG